MPIVLAQPLQLFWITIKKRIMRVVATLLLMFFAIQSYAGEFKDHRFSPGPKSIGGRYLSGPSRVDSSLASGKTISKCTCLCESKGNINSTRFWGRVCREKPKRPFDFRDNSCEDLNVPGQFEFDLPPSQCYALNDNLGCEGYRWDRFSEQWVEVSKREGSYTACAYEP